MLSVSWTNHICIIAEIRISLKLLAKVLLTLRHPINPKSAGTDLPSEVCLETQIYFIDHKYFVDIKK